MADQRQYNVTTTTNFDGTTAATEALAWSPGIATQSASANVRYRSVSTGVVGRFSPTILGRDSRAPALVRVWADRVSVGDVYRVVASANPADASPTLTVRQSAPLTVGQQQATILELGMTDELVIITSDPATCHIEVTDLDEAQLYGWLLAKFRNDAALTGSTLSEITVTAAGIIPSVPGHLLVNVDIPAGGAALQLPDLAGGELSPGDRITFWRSSGDPGRSVAIQTQTGADLVNGLGGVVQTTYYLRDKGDSISYLVTESRGYQREFGEQATVESSAATNPQALFAPKGGIGFHRDEGTAQDTQLDLPQIDDATDFIPTGAGLVVLNTDTLRHKVVPSLGDGEKINGLDEYFVQPRSAALFLAVRTDPASAISSWRGIGGGNQGRSVTSAAAVNLTAADVSSGVATVETTGAAGQDVLLPPVNQVANGSIIVHYNSSANTHDLIPNGTDKINGANVATTLATTKRQLIVAMGPTIGWVTILGA